MAGDASREMTGTGERNMGIRISEKCRKISPSATLKLNALVAELKAKGRDVISMAAGEPDMDTPERIKSAAIKALREGKTKYTATAGILPLRQAIADSMNRRLDLDFSARQILVSSGAKQALLGCLTAVLNPGDEVLMPTPCWLSYPELVRMADGVPVPVENRKESGYVPDLSDLSARLTDKTRAILYSSPNNPTGAVYNREQLTMIAAFAREHDLVIISDEIYKVFVYDGAEHLSIASLNEDARERTVVVSGFSKAFAMTGWRLGYAAGPKELIDAMDAYQSHAAGNPNSLAQYAGLAAMEDSHVTDDIVAAFTRRRKTMLEELKKIPQISFFTPPGAFYVLIDLGNLLGKHYQGREITDDGVFAELLLEAEGVSIVPGGPFFAPGSCRLSYAINEEKIVEALRRLAVFVSEIR